MLNFSENVKTSFQAYGLPLALLQLLPCHSIWPWQKRLNNWLTAEQFMVQVVPKSQSNYKHVLFHGLFPIQSKKMVKKKAGQVDANEGNSNGQNDINE